VNFPTRGEYLLDHFYTNSYAVDGCIVVDNFISDHKTILYKSNLNSVENAPAFIKKRIFSSNSISNFKDYLRDEDWIDVFDCVDTDGSMEVFLRIFNYYFEICFPKKRFKLDYNSKVKWIDPEITASSERVNNLRVLSRTYPPLVPYFKAAKQNHNTLLANKQKTYYQNKISQSPNPTREAWNLINSESGKFISRRTKNIELSINNSVTKDPQQVADAFNLYFKNAPINTVNDIPRQLRKAVGSLSTSKDSLFLSPMSKFEVQSILSTKIKAKKSCGPDDIPSFLLGNVASEISNPLTYLINLSFASGNFVVITVFITFIE